MNPRKPPAAEASLPGKSVSPALLPRSLKKGATLRFLDSLQSPDQAGTLAIGVSYPIPKLALELLAKLPQDQRLGATRLLEGSDTGALLFSAPGCLHILVPPFPITEEGTWSRWHTQPLRNLLASRLVLGVVLVRLGGYAVAVFDGDRMVSAKVGTGYVHGRHKAGGWSQKRFARRREKQAQDLFDRVCEVAMQQFTPAALPLDYVLLGGDRRALHQLLDRCAHLKGFGHRLLGRVLSVGQPDREALEGILEEAWKSKVLSLPSA